MPWIAHLAQWFRNVNGCVNKNKNDATDIRRGCNNKAVVNTGAGFMAGDRQRLRSTSVPTLPEGSIIINISSDIIEISDGGPGGERLAASTAQWERAVTISYGRCSNVETMLFPLGEGRRRGRCVAE